MSSRLGEEVRRAPAARLDLKDARSSARGQAKKSERRKDGGYLLVRELP